MNEFQYQLELAKIASAKYVKDVRLLVYNYYDPLNSTYYKAIFFKEGELYFHYKLFSKAFTKFHQLSSASLPDKFDDLLKWVQRRVLEKISKECSMNYEEILDLFEYNNLVILPNLSAQPFKNFCDIIGSNPLPFELTINVYPTVLPTHKYFANLDHSKELAILTWMKSEGIPEDFTVTAQFRNDHQYINKQHDHQAALAERANLVLALESIDQLTGVPIYDQQ